jgi:hypothetical protein
MSRHLPTVLLTLLALLTLPFVVHSLDRPLAAYLGDDDARGRLFHPGDLAANLSIYAHMVTGGLITFLAPLQLIPAIRRNAPRLHRLTGYTLAPLAIFTGLAGLGYIAQHGTVGGAWMSGWFALYGVLMIVAGTETLRHARARDFARHRRWAIRLVVLALGSYLYRVGYGMNYMTVGGLGVDDFQGTFDRAMVWAFFVVPLGITELAFRAGRPRPARA